jgi:hypothetical protein
MIATLATPQNWPKKKKKNNTGMYVSVFFWAVKYCQKEILNIKYSTKIWF